MEGWRQLIEFVSQLHTVRTKEEREAIADLIYFTFPAAKLYFFYTYERQRSPKLGATVTAVCLNG